jgi:hypothetical protein
MFTPNPKPVTAQTPREIDEQLAHWYGLLSEAGYTLKSAQNRYDREAPTATPNRLQPFADALARARARVEELHATIKPFNEEFTRRGGWKRYFLVTKGHVHRERNCHTCNHRTVFGWLPELSDCDETKMVEVYGDQACAECFPGVLNHPAFLAGAKLRKAHEDALKAAQCPTSAQPVGKANRTPNGRRARCPRCNSIVPITKYGLFRQHNPPPPR